MVRAIACLLTGSAGLAAAGAALGQAAAPEVNGYVTIATGYWDRGLSHSDAGAVLQAGADYQHGSGLFVGGTVVDVDYAGSAASTQPELEVDAYVGFHRRSAVWSWTVALGRYLYPDGGGSYDYNEIAASIGYRDRLFFSTSYTNDFYSLRWPAWNSEVALTFPLPADFEISATLGRFDLDVAYGGDFTHWNVGVSRATRRVAVDARYHHTSYDAVTLLGDPGGDRWVLSVSYAFRERLRD